MSRSNEERIQDILEAAAKVQEIAEAGEQAYRAGWMRRTAAERLMQVIGEAASKLSPEAQDRYPDVPWQALRGFRNFVVHEYHKVDHQLVWNAMVADVPSLIRALAAGQADLSRDD
ncbi:DUF86 domain-containing protein [Candidatus Poriferisodalis sp.]|uniref:HepT-like ribonuclease domain-containing protein n=1 Tax=Candidatus Poriferisodalis sp. TaxID=3101277 RepID=UPI003C7022A1